MKRAHPSLSISQSGAKSFSDCVLFGLLLQAVQQLSGPVQLNGCVCVCVYIYIYLRSFVSL